MTDVACAPPDCRAVRDWTTSDTTTGRRQASDTDVSIVSFGGKARCAIRCKLLETQELFWFTTTFHRGQGKSEHKIGVWCRMR